MEHAFVAVACGAGLIGIDSRNDHQFIGNLVVYFFETVCVFAYSIFVVCRAGTDQNNKFIRLSGKNFADLAVSQRFY